MKRSKSQPQATRKKKAAAPKPTAPALSRRQVLGGWAKTGLGIAVVGGGAGLLLTRTVAADVHEHDLTRIGQGIPMVVQVHDPMCPTCLALQKQVRKAMRAFDDDTLQYAIASLDKPEGRDLAIRNGVGKITLILFDAEGNRQAILHGPNSSDRLERAFRAHIGQS